MDFLPSPVEPKHLHVHIPYVAQSYQYSPPFATFVQRIKHADTDLPTNDLVNLEQMQNAIHRLNAIWQAWLFFGLLEECFGYVPREEWLCPDPDREGEQLITCAKLPEIRDTFMSSLPPDEVSEHSQRIGHCFNVINNMLNWPAFPPDMPAGCEELIETHEKLVMHIKCVADFVLPGAVFTIRGPRSRYVIDRMKADGWCPSRIETIEGLSNAHQYFISQMRPPIARSGNHDSCTNFQCFANQISEDSYVQVHSETCKDERQCDAVTVSPDILRKAYSAGLPTMAVIQEQGVTRVDVAVRGSPPGKWVSISHVWSHGLGNPKSNSLPFCQVLKIGAMIEALYATDKDSENGPKYFWIDTLLCSASDAETKKEALKRMAWIYGSADKILVLDEYLLQIETKGRSYDELALRILCSDWTSRLWTFQEGVINHKGQVCFQFKDQAVSMDHLRSSRGGDIHTPIHADDIDYALVGISLRPVNLRLDSRLELIANALRHRSTTKPSDEVLCLGMLMRMSQADILEAPEEERMMMFWQSISQPPCDIVFWKGIRMSEEGFRWAPKTFLGSRMGNKLFRPTVQETKRTARGLEISSAGLRLPALQGAIGNAFFVRDDRGIFYVAQYDDGPNSYGGHYPFEHSRNAIDDVGSSVTKFGSGTPDLALILSQSNEFHDAFDSREYGGPPIQHNAVLVQVMADEDGMMYVRTLTDDAGFAATFAVRPQTLRADGRFHSDMDDYKQLAVEIDQLPRSYERDTVGPIVIEGLGSKPPAWTMPHHAVNGHTNQQVEWPTVDQNRGKWSCRFSNGTGICEGVILPSVQRWCVD